MLGAQSLIWLLDFRVASPSYLIDLSGKSDLNYIRRPVGGLGEDRAIGAPAAVTNDVADAIPHTPGRVTQTRLLPRGVAAPSQECKHAAE